MDSAQPISRPSEVQPGWRNQALHLSPRVMPKPIDELASENAQRSRMGWGEQIGQGMDGEDNLAHHHLRSSVVPQGSVLGLKGSSSNMPSMRSRDVRYGFPSRNIRAVCTSLPCSFCTSSRTCVCDNDQLSMAVMYFMHLGSESCTVQRLRSHMKPMKRGVDEKGMSFDVSHGMPSSCEMLSMSLML